MHCCSVVRRRSYKMDWWCSPVNTLTHTHISQWAVCARCGQLVCCCLSQSRASPFCPFSTREELDVIVVIIILLIILIRFFLLRCIYCSLFSYLLYLLFCRLCWGLSDPAESLSFVGSFFFLVVFFHHLSGLRPASELYLCAFYVPLCVTWKWRNGCRDVPSQVSSLLLLLIFDSSLRRKRSDDDKR